MSTSGRAVVGFLVAPAVPALIAYIATLPFRPHWEAAWGSMILAVFGYLGALVIGVPLYLLLQQRAVASLWAYVLLGALIGLICYALYFILAPIVLNTGKTAGELVGLVKQNAGLAIPAIVSGVAASSVFWFIAIRRIG